jgi:hypothetical protein
MVLVTSEKKVAKIGIGLGMKIFFTAENLKQIPFL